MNENLQYSSEESQSEDDEDGWKVTEEVEKEFYKTLSQIKNKDPKIYKKDVAFFKDLSIPEEKRCKKEKTNPFTLRDYERKIIVEKGGELSDEELPEMSRKPIREPTYVEEQEYLKNSLKAALISDSDDDEEDDCGGLLKRRENTEKDEKEEEESYKEWLKGQKSDVPDEEVREQMKPLRQYWTNPNLDQEEQFLRDYVLNKKYLEHKDDNKMNVGEPEENEPFEVDEECSHRFEEQDQEFIKRYPRNMENSLRRKKDHRKQKREEVKERKIKEKEKKMIEIKQKKKLKKKQIEEKLEELKKLTGNKQLAFENVLDKDFDFDEHDKAMQRLFNEEFYSQEDPDFIPNNSAVDEEAWNEDWQEESQNGFEENEELNCEDPNFIMDCDYDPTQQKPKEKTSRSRRRKDKHKRTTLSEAVNKEKPVFDPTTHKSFQEYVDQYYSIDCEDFIGDLPCRFKYRRTVPNSFGLTIEEILAADEKELERWCSIKRIHQLRPEHKEKCDLKVFKKKAADEELKRKILPSLYKKQEDTKKTEDSEKKKTGKNKPNNTKNNSEVSDTVSVDKTKKINESKKQETEHLETKEDTNESPLPNENSTNLSKKKKKKKKKRLKQSANLQVLDDSKNIIKTHEQKNCKRKLANVEVVAGKKRKRNSQNNSINQKLQLRNNNYHEKSKEDSSLTQLSDARLLAYGIKPKKFRNKLKYNKS